MHLFIWRPTGALPLRASSGQKNGFGALRTCKTDAPDASDDLMLIYIRVNVWDDDDDADDWRSGLGSGTRVAVTTMTTIMIRQKASRLTDN